MNKSKLDKYVDLGLIRSQTSGALTIYVYTEFTVYERLWNSVTRQCRGLVVDDNDRIVIRCLPKFFNAGEPEAVLESPKRPQSTVIQDKVDGSLIQVADDLEHGLVVTSKGSFASDQARWAREIIEERGMRFDRGLTYIFELIHPENRIVVDYGGQRELVLLAALHTETGAECDIYTDRFAEFSRAALLSHEDIHALDRAGRLAEGVVINMDGYRVKVKTDEYLRLHRIVTNFTPRRVWESLSNGESLEFEGMPEEFQDWLDSTVADLRCAFAALRTEIDEEFRRAQHLTNKELGLSDDYQYKSFIFSLRNGRDIAPAIWKRLKPNSSDLEGVA